MTRLDPRWSLALQLDQRRASQLRVGPKRVSAAVASGNGCSCNTAHLVALGHSTEPRRRAKPEILLAVTKLMYGQLRYALKWARGFIRAFRAAGARHASANHAEAQQRMGDEMATVRRLTVIFSFALEADGFYDRAQTSQFVLH